MPFHLHLISAFLRPVPLETAPRSVIALYTDIPAARCVEKGSGLSSECSRTGMRTEGRWSYCMSTRKLGMPGQMSSSHFISCAHRGHLPTHPHTCAALSRRLKEWHTKKKPCSPLPRFHLLWISHVITFQQLISIRIRRDPSVRVQITQRAVLGDSPSKICFCSVFNTIRPSRTGRIKPWFLVVYSVLERLHKHGQCSLFIEGRFDNEIQESELNLLN
ncbi:hypothetical protein BXZ70DRAFT_770305 [Cristinia sonorae]|uniref:Uncharacterized protein n=1 Tax=Cristinia sonorae TaxID=1940300 RepID=A0A8K0XRY6_9AGAR|nr:hypothetical protein BXZ70DRAFT_770305 [Cristinia sonorae]